MAFAPNGRARLPLSPPEGGLLTTRQASLNAADRLVAPPQGLSTLGFDPARFRTEPPACYRASWQLPGPDSHRQATTSFMLDQLIDQHLQRLGAPRGDVTTPAAAATPAEGLRRRSPKRDAVPVTGGLEPRQRVGWTQPDCRPAANPSAAAPRARLSTAANVDPPSARSAPSNTPTTSNPITQLD